MLLPLLAFLLAPLAAPPADVEELVERYADGTPRVVREVRRDADGQAINHGAYVSYHPNGKKEAEGRYLDGARTGEWVFRWENGRRREAGKYVDGTRSGPWKQFHERGGKEAQGPYRDGHRHGEWTFYDRQGEPDPTRSGTYEWIDVGEDAFFYGGAGATLEGRKIGPWTFRWPNGVVMAEATYAAGSLQGDLAFFRPDGSFEPVIFSGTYRGGRRLAPLAEARPDGPAGAEPVSFVFGDMQPTPLVDAWLDGSGVPPDTLRARLHGLGRDAVPSLLDRLARCDLGTLDGRDAARRIHGLLADVFGGHAYAWSDDDAPAGAEVRRRAVQRWPLAWVAFAGLDEVWSIDFAPLGSAREKPDESVLLDLPLPDILGNPTAVPVPRPDLTAELPTPAAGAGAKFGGRRGLRAAGGQGTEQAVANGLAWLVAHQEDDGHWDCAKHGGSPYFDVGVTAQALLALVQDGNTAVRGDYPEAVVRGIRWLLGAQDPSHGQIVTRRRDEEGRLRTGPEPIYEHLLATHALAEAARVTRSPLLHRRLRRAVDHFLAMRNPDGLWEYADGAFTGDCSVSVSAIVPLKTAAAAGIEIDASVFDALAGWLDAVSDDTSGKAVSPSVKEPVPGELRFSPDRDPDPTASVLLGRYWLGPPADTPVIEKHVQRLLQVHPRWNEDAEGYGMHYVHDGSHAMVRRGQGPWKAWNEAMKASLLAEHLQDGERAGSWDPIGPHGRAGGRVLATALATRTLQAYYWWVDQR